MPSAPTTVPAELIPKADGRVADVQLGHRPGEGIGGEVGESGHPVHIEVVPTTWPLLQIPFMLEPVAVPVSGESVEVGELVAMR